MIILQDFGSIYGNLQTCSTIFIFFNINFVFDESWRGDAICVEESIDAPALHCYQLSHDTYDYDTLKNDREETNII